MSHNNKRIYNTILVIILLSSQFESSTKTVQKVYSFHSKSARGASGADILEQLAVPVGIRTAVRKIFQNVQTCRYNRR